MRFIGWKLLGAWLIITATGQAFAADAKVRVGYTAVSDFASVFVAKEQGIFAKQGIDAELTLVAINSTLPAALVSRSLDVGGMTPPVLLQAIAADIKLTVVSGVSATTDVLTFGAMARTGLTIKSAKDVEGKKVGVPGLGATLHILFVRWLKNQGVDPKQVTFVETPFPVHADALKAGTVDVVVTAQPNIDRIVNTSVGSMFVDLGADIKGRPGAYWVAASAWVQANPAVAKNFREAIREAGVLIDSNAALAREDIAKYVKLPPQIIATLPLPKVVADVNTADIDWWAGVLTDQNLIDKKLNAASFVAK